jgi:hypothetical protein
MILFMLTQPGSSLRIDLAPIPPEYRFTDTVKVFLVRCEEPFAPADMHPLVSIFVLEIGVFHLDRPDG